MNQKHPTSPLLCAALALIIFLLLPWLIVMLTGWFSYLGRNYTPLLHDLLTGRR